MQKNYTLWILLATILLALGPIFVSQIGPAGQARWMVARSANEYQDGNPETAQKTLDAAITKSVEVAADEEYWRLRFQIVFGKQSVDSVKAGELCDEAISTLLKLDESQRSRAAAIVANYFVLNQRVHLAVRTLENVLPKMELRSAEDNNSLAYMRSLEKKNLEVALKEVDLALAMDQSNSQILDTKAWILHGLNRNEVALKFASECIRKYYAQEDVARFFGMEKTITVPITPASPKTPERSVTENTELIASKSELPRNTGLPNSLDLLKLKNPFYQNKIENHARVIAVLRFHRASILEDLGRDDEADMDYAWLDMFGFEDTQNLK